MTETENLVLEHLSYIRGAVDVLREDLCEVKERLGTLEANYASVSRRVDRIEARIERIEKRLDLTMEQDMSDEAAGPGGRFWPVTGDQMRPRTPFKTNPP